MTWRLLDLFRHLLGQEGRVERAAEAVSQAAGASQPANGCVVNKKEKKKEGKKVCMDR